VIGRRSSVSAGFTARIYYSWGSAVRAPAASRQSDIDRRRTRPEPYDLPMASLEETEPRIMGLDVGDRRIGIAVSDPLGLTAQPVLTLVRTNRKQDLKSIQRLIRRHNCSAIVVGNPLYMSGDQSPQAAKAQAFAQMLRDETGLPVHLWDERLTTTEAHRHLHAAGRAGSEHKAVVDQVAAVLILESFLQAQKYSSS
jgi:putative holliday junction resolvase